MVKPLNFPFWPAVVACCAVTWPAVFPHASIGEESPMRRLLVGFDDARAARLTPNKSRFEIVKQGNEAALEIITDAATDYPSVRIEPAGEGTAPAWDLTGYEAAELDVRNLEEVSLRVLLSVNNPNADGQNHCNVASSEIGPGEKGMVVVPFGQWHGEPRPLDLTQVVSFDVLLDRPGRSHRFAVDALRVVRHEPFDLERAKSDLFFQSLAPPADGGYYADGIVYLGRGINLGNALEAPHEGEWGVVLDAEYFRAIAAAGFDSIRLPVRWSAHAQHEAPYSIDPEFFSRVDWAIDQALGQRLTVVVNVHHYEELTERPDEHRHRLIAIWRQIAEHYRDRPPSLGFELLNEPHDRLTAAKWNAILAACLRVVRASNPERTVVVGPTAWNGIGELKSLELPEDDRRLLVTVHYYGPFAFTHQGAPWLDAESRPPLGARWMGSDAERAALLRDLDAAAQWGLEHRRPIYLGEFGALNTADIESRVRWTKFVAEEALRRRMTFAYWEFCSGFGAYDAAKKTWIEPLRDALLPASRE